MLSSSFKPNKWFHYDLERNEVACHVYYKLSTRLKVKRELLALFWKLLGRSRAAEKQKILRIDPWEEVIFQTTLDSNLGAVSSVSELATLPF